VAQAVYVTAYRSSWRSTARDYLTTVIGSFAQLPEKFAELDRQEPLTLKAMKSTDSSAFSKMIFKQLQLNDIKTLVKNRLQTGTV
jgi:hypothetical protein